MRYHCIDAGTEKCPCMLMEAEQCYTCRMSREGICSCGDNWRGSCPYTVWMQQGGRTQPAPSVIRAPILAVRAYEQELSVVSLSVPCGFAQHCHRLGTYIIVEALGWQIPLSVLHCTYDTDTGDTNTEDANTEDVALQNGRIEIALQPIGPKSKALLRDQTADWKIRGPFYGGLMRLGNCALHASEPLLVIARGTAIAPFINMKEAFCRLRVQEADAASKASSKIPAAASNLMLLIDDEKLSATFLADYLQTEAGIPIPWQPIRLAAEMKRAAAWIRKSRQSMVLVSPYYAAEAKKIFEACTKEFSAAKSDCQGLGRCLMLPNHANICCGIGICGACSETDAEGVTLRKCKCVQTETVIR